MVHHRNYPLFLPLTLTLGPGSTSFVLCTCEICSCCDKRFRRCIYKKIQYLTLLLPTTQGCPVPSTSWDIYIYAHAKFEVAKSNGFAMHLQENISFVAQYPLQHVTYSPALRLTVWKKMHLQGNTLFDLGDKVKQNVAQYPLHRVNYAPVKFKVAASNG